MPGLSVTGSLLVSLHGGMGLEHPELESSWPPTLTMLKSLSPIWFAVSSFNVPEHEAAEAVLRRAFLKDMIVERSGVNPCGSLHGPDEIGPFDGIQGKRNYCICHLRTEAATGQDQGAEWDLFN